jgi:hypothetical protein
MTNNDSRWLKTAFRQAPWRTQTQATSLVLAVVVLFVVIGALYLAQASRTAAAGRSLLEMEAERQLLEQQNAQLRAEIAALRSVQRLTAEAEALGYHTADSTEVEYLLVRDVPLPAAPAPVLPPAEDESLTRYDETLESWLNQQLAAFREQFRQFLARTFGRAGGAEADEAAGDEVETLPADSPQETPDE